MFLVGCEKRTIENLDSKIQLIENRKNYGSLDYSFLWSLTLS